ncbi:uncharacterized protein PRCAT00001610001 [Priceomyces carsonii]|uniref:uncharacterized protein n=1 Tax=Priceomyces carsonii TaxID=28549 RepID=UPI002ED937E1|nr:unnamed protein product [Priceomyces carsonii]
MPSNLRYSAASSSTIHKRPSLSPIKKAQRDLKRSLPSQTKYLQNLKKRNNKKSQLPSKTSNGEGKLSVTDYDVEFDYQLSKNEDLEVAIDTIVDNQWSESTSLHSRYHTKDEIRSANSMEELVFLLKGLSMIKKAEIMKFRSQIPEGLVTINQLYAIYERQGNTFVDRNLEVKIRQGKMKKFIITNAAPVILRSFHSQGRITYGHENVEVVVKSEVYLDSIDKIIAYLERQEKEELLSTAEKHKFIMQRLGLKNFKNFLIENPLELFINKSNAISSQELSSLVSLGYVTLTSNHLNEIEAHQYAISYPNCGTFLKLVNAGRSWLVKTLTKSKYSENLEDQIFSKWEGTTGSGDNKLNNFKKPFYGYDLNWILADALGAGIIEVFNTPVGRGWRLTGKV